MGYLSLYLKSLSSYICATQSPTPYTQHTSTHWMIPTTKNIFLHKELTVNLRYEIPIITVIANVGLY